MLANTVDSKLNEISQQAVYPAAELILIKDFMDELNIPAQRWLQGTGLSPEYFRDSEQWVSMDQFDLVYRNVFRLIKVSDKGLKFGQRLNLSRWGLLASALISSQTLETALYTASKYKSLLRSRFHIRTEVKGTVYHFPLEPIQHLRFPVNEQFGYEVTLASLQQQISDLLGQPFHFEEIGLPYPEPEYVRLYQSYFKCPIHFQSAAPFYAIKKQTLKQKLPLANRANKVITLRLCERELSRIEHHWKQDIPTLIRQAFHELNHAHWSLNEFASHLRLSPRTLRRKLQDAGTNFRAIKHEHVMNLACEKLSNEDVSIQKISEVCGYEDVNSFREAFKRFTGLRPKDYRKANL